MQYILTEEEYKKLAAIDRTKVIMDKSELQKLCTLAANNIPLNRDWDKGDKSPGGCILDETNASIVCDDCLVINYCPCGYKQFSE